MDNELPAVLRDRVKGNRNFTRYHVTIAALIWPASIGEFPGRVDKDLTIANRVCIENLSLTRLFFISPVYYAINKKIWVRMRIEDKSWQFQAIIRRTTDMVVSEQKFFGCGAQFIGTPAFVEALPALAEYLTSQDPVTKKVKAPSAKAA